MDAHQDMPKSATLQIPWTKVNHYSVQQCARALTAWTNQRMENGRAPGHAEIGDLADQRLLPVDKQVGRLEVTVHDALVVQVEHALGSVECERYAYVPGETLAPWQRTPATCGTEGESLFQ